MAKTSNQSTKTPGQLSQMWSVYKLTAREDKSSVVWSIVIFIAVVAAAVVFASAAFPGNVLNLVIFSILGIMFGVLGVMILMGRKAEKAAYSRIAGQFGAVGAVMGSQLRRGWRSAEMPVAINPRSQDAVYRAIGPGGVVLIGEGTRSRVKLLLEDERRKVNRVAPGAPVELLYVTNDAEAVKLPDLSRSLYKMKRVMNRAEISVVAKRLESLGMNIPIPKGMDPTKLRAQRR
ncbi:MAG: hypothetical protein RL100_290 [Actinomycetota bacterium]|jgi:hypothetical protein